MAIQQGVWGIDIGQCALKALRLEVIDDVVTATAFDYVEHPKILSQPDADPDQLTREALETFLSRNTIKGDQIAMSVAGQSGLARFVKLPPVEEKKIADIVRFEAKQQIPFPLDEVVWDFQKVNTGTVSDGFAMDTEIGLFAMKRDMINRFLHHFQAVKVEVHIVQMSPLALCNYVTYDLLKRGPDGQSRKEVSTDDTPTGKRRCVVALDIGTDGSSLIITDGERIIWQRPIPIGGNHFTRALTKELKLTFAKAEHLKRNAAKSPDLAKILKALRPVLTDFVNEVQRSLGYFTNTHRDAHVAYMVGLGSAFRLPGLQKFLSEKLQLDVRKPGAFEELTGETVVTAPVFTENLLSFPVAYGLALQGLKQSRLTTNLLPQEIQFDRMIRAKKPWSVAAAAAILLGVGIVSFGFGMRSKSLGNPVNPDATPNDPIAKAVKEAKGAADAAGAKKSEATAKQNEITNTTKDVKSIIAGKDERPNWILLNEFVSNCLPLSDGSNLTDYKDNNPVVEQRRFWTAAARDANQQYLDRRLGKGNVVDLPMDEASLKNLINIDIEAVFPMYVDDLKTFYEKAKEITTTKFGQPLLGLGIYSPPGGAKKYSEEFPTGAGWVVEVRGYTYFHDYREFLRNTLIFNLNHDGRGTAESWVPFGSGATATPSPMGATATATPNKPGEKVDPIRGRVSHAFIYTVQQVPDAQPGQFTLINNSYLQEVVGGRSAGGGGGPGLPGSTGSGSGGFSPTPGSGSSIGSGGMGGGAGSSGSGGSAVGASRSSWQPIGGNASSSSNVGGGFKGGVSPMGGGMTAGGGGAMAPSEPMGGVGGVGGAPSPGSNRPTKTTGKRVRYEFVVFFVWREPVGADTPTTK